MTDIAFEVSLAQPFDQAIDTVTAALKAEGFGILTRIDVDTTLKEKIGADFRRYVILGACNPALAYRALSEDARVGLLLPCNVTVEAEPAGKGVTVRIGNPEVLMAAGGFEVDAGMRAVAQEAREKLERAAVMLRG